MLDILDSYMRTATTPELHKLIDDAHGALKQLGRDDFDDYFTELLLTDGDRDEGETLQAIIQGTQGLLHDTLKEHGVRLIPDTPIEVLVTTVKAISAITTYGNTEELLSIILAGKSANPTFADIVQAVAGIDQDNFMVNIESVDSVLILRIRQLLTKKEEEVVTEEEVLIRNTHAQKLRFFMGYIQKEKLEMANMVKDGMPLGYPFKVYADFIGRRFETFPPEKIAHEMYAMALCAVDGINNPRAIINANINNYIADLTTITKVDVIVNDLMVKLAQHG